MEERPTGDGWEGLYAGTDRLRESRPAWSLVEYERLIPRGPVLDIGAGEGANALWLASRGFEVEAVERSATAAQRLRASASEQGLTVTIREDDLRSIDYPQARYALIVADMVLQFLLPEELEAVIARCKEALVPGGLMLMSVFSVEDPAFRRHRRDSRELDRNTFYSERLEGPVRFFVLDEIRSLLAGLETVMLMRGTALDLTHGEPHEHGIIAALARKQ
jgi:SAM-dependent methyltransferase